MTDTLTAVADSTGADQADPRRSDFAAILADLAVILREHPAIPLPSFYSDEIRFLVFGAAAREIIATIRRAIGGTWDKQPRETESGAYLDYATEWHGWLIKVVTGRESVCRKVVKGTRQVTRKIPDPEALAAVPEIEITETEQDIEWVCEPLLAPRPLAVDAPEAIEAVPADREVAA